MSKKRSAIIGLLVNFPRRSHPFSPQKTPWGNDFQAKTTIRKDVKSEPLLSAPQTSFQVLFVILFLVFLVFWRFLAFLGGFGGFWALFSDSLGFFTSIALGFVPKDPNWSGNGPKQNFQKTLKTCLTSAQFWRGTPGTEINSGTLGTLGAQILNSPVSRWS